METIKTLALYKVDKLCNSCPTFDDPGLYKSEESKGLMLMQVSCRCIGVIGEAKLCAYFWEHRKTIPNMSSQLYIK